MADQLLAALGARLGRFAKSRDPSEVLDPAALDEAAELWETAKRAGDDVHSVPVDILAALAYLHWYRFQAMPPGQAQEDLRQAVFFFGALSDQAPERVPPDIRSALSETQTEPTDMDAAVTSSRDAASAPGDPHLSKHMAMICSSLVTGFRRTGDSADLDTAIDAIQKALDLGVMSRSDQAGVLSDLAASLNIRYDLAGNRADLDDAIRAGHEAVDLTSHGSSDRPGYLSNLGSFRLKRFEVSGDRADLEAAIRAGHEAVDLTTKADDRRAGRLSNLGNALGVWFGVTGNDGDLDAAITAQQEAVEAAPPGHPDLRLWLSNLGSSLLARFNRLGRAADLDDGIDRLQQAQAIAGTSVGPDRAACLVNLANALLTRFLRARDDTDLDTAINAGHQAMTAMPPDSPDWARILGILASCLLTRFERGRVAKDLDDAIDNNRQAVATTAPSSPAVPELLSNLGNSLRARYKANGDVADLDAAIRAGQQAVDATPSGHPNRAGYLSNLGAAFGDRFRLTGICADLDAAIGAGQQAVDATPPGHPDLALYLSDLGTSLLLGFERACPNGDLDKALDCWRQASQVSTGTPSIRLDAAQRWGAVAADHGRMGSASQGYAVAVGLLPEVAWHGLDRTTREEQLSRWAGLAADAAACMIQDGRPELAVELLEQGRSVLWAQALNLRSDLTQLAEMAPDLADRLQSIRAILDSPIAQATPLMSQRAEDIAPAGNLIRPEQDAIDQRRRLSRQWDEVVAQVRDLDGFEHFLAAIPYPELASAVAGGPVVIVNASRHGCHALIVAARSEVPRVVDLPRLSLDAAAGQANKILTALAGGANNDRSFRDREKARHAVLDVLDWLWESVAEPVLAALGHTTSTEADEPWPRVWWCPTGPLTVLPIHAAGHHPRLGTAVRGDDFVLDRVISSYTLTLTALARAHKAVPPAPVRQLTVGMPTTPGQTSLPAVEQELEVLSRYFPQGNANLQLVGPQAICPAVQAAIADHSWVHLACHAAQQHANPDSSGFVLWDSTLTITNLASQPTQHRDFAFLSACQTATGSIRHFDEAIHLAAVMQFLGYRQVIATMWTIADSPAPQVADIVYAKITHGGTPDAGRTANAVHQASRSLLKTDPTNPLLWAPYIHLGA